MYEELVLKIVEETLATRPHSAERMTDAGRSTVFSVRLGDREVIVRMHADAHQFASTQHNLEVLAGLGLPVPRVLAADLTCSRYPVAYLILTKLPGRDLRHELSSMTEAQMTRLARQIVEIQASVATLPVRMGFGYAGIGQSAPHASWWDVLLAESAWNIRGERTLNSAVASAGRAELDLQIRLRRQINVFESRLRSTPPICFLDDITVKNVLIVDGELQGLVDFDCVCYGDPLFWLGLTAAGVVCDIDRRELFYVEELCRFLELDRSRHRMFLLYASWIALGFVATHSSEQTHLWLLKMLSVVEDWVTELEMSGGSN